MRIDFTGQTRPCFMSTSGRPVAQKRLIPDFDQKLKELAAETKAGTE